MDWNAFRDEVCTWSTKNFGDQTTLRPFIGLIEEIGELVSSYNSKGLYDAVGDALVYLGDYTGRRNIDLNFIVVNPLCLPAGFYPHQYKHEFIHIIKAVGRACHAVLKLDQGIRVNESHKDNLISALREIVLWLRGQLNDSSIEGLWSVVQMTWTEVKQRDWSKNKVDGTVNSD